MIKEFEFDMAFSSFIDGAEYEKTEGVLFNLVLAAFTAGWMAAGGNKKTKSLVKSRYNNSDTGFKIPEKLRKVK